jgi:hypothetical protein
MNTYLFFAAVLIFAIGMLVIMRDMVIAFDH